MLLMENPRGIDALGRVPIIPTSAAGRDGFRRQMRADGTTYCCEYSYSKKKRTESAVSVKKPRCPQDAKQRGRNREEAESNVAKLTYP
jgi:hypothetical protein